FSSTCSVGAELNWYLDMPTCDGAPVRGCRLEAELPREVHRCAAKAVSTRQFNGDRTVERSASGRNAVKGHVPRLARLERPLRIGALEIAPARPACPANPRQFRGRRWWRRRRVQTRKAAFIVDVRLFFLVGRRSDVRRGRWRRRGCAGDRILLTDERRPAVPR